MFSFCTAAGAVVASCASCAACAAGAAASTVDSTASCDFFPACCILSNIISIIELSCVDLLI
jgi:hypothetical protein